MLSGWVDSVMRFLTLPGPFINRLKNFNYFLFRKVYHENCVRSVYRHFELSIRISSNLLAKISWHCSFKFTKKKIYCWYLYIIVSVTILAVTFVTKNAVSFLAIVYDKTPFLFIDPLFHYKRKWNLILNKLCPHCITSMIYLGLNDSYNKIELKWQMKAFLIVNYSPPSQ